MVHCNGEGDEEAAGQPEQSINGNGVWNSDEDPEGIEQDYEQDQERQRDNEQGDDNAELSDVPL